MKSETKNILLIVTLVLGLILSYNYAISPTLKLQAEYSDLKQEDQLYKNSPKQISVLLSRQKEFDSVLRNKNLGSNSMENNLLRILNIQAESKTIKVLDFNDPQVFENNGSVINTFDFTLEGDFTQMLKTIYVVEQKNSLGEIAHLHFKKQKNYRTRKDFLTARVLIQQIK